MSSIFDPLGFLAVVLFPASSLLQDIWRTSVGWDDPINDQHFLRFQEWFTSLSHLSTLTIPRCYFSRDYNFSFTQLHIFADASEPGYGAVAYLRREFSERYEISFVMAKTRVAPIKFVTIPRLELCAVVMVVRLKSSLSQELKIAIDQIIFFYRLHYRLILDQVDKLALPCLCRK